MQMYQGILYSPNPILCFMDLNGYTHTFSFGPALDQDSTVAKKTNLFLASISWSAGRFFSYGAMKMCFIHKWLYVPTLFIFTKAIKN